MEKKKPSSPSPDKQQGAIPSGEGDFVQSEEAKPPRKWTKEEMSDAQPMPLPEVDESG